MKFKRIIIPLLVSLISINLFGCKKSSNNDDIKEEEPISELPVGDYPIIENINDWRVQYPSGIEGGGARVDSIMNVSQTKYLNYNESDKYIELNLNSSDNGTTPGSNGLRVELDGQHFNIKTPNNPSGLSKFEYNYNFELDYKDFMNAKRSVCIGQVIRLSSLDALAKPFIMIYVRNDIWDQTRPDENGVEQRSFPEAKEDVAGLYAFISYYGKDNSKARDRSKFYLGDVYNNKAVNVNIKYENNKITITRGKYNASIIQDELINEIADIGFSPKVGLYLGGDELPNISYKLKLRNIYFR